MANGPKQINGVPAEDILEHSIYDPARVQRISFRKFPSNELRMYDYNPEWPAHFETLKQRIVAALGPTQDDTSSDPASGNITDSDAKHEVKVLGIYHRGSTSVPGLPAKNAIDIDLVLSDNTLEDQYVPGLEAAGFQFLIREPRWHEHRFFASPPDPAPCNLHVWGPRCPEVERHRIFHEWLLAHDEDRDLYAKTKRECAEAAAGAGEDILQYNKRKEWVIQEILERAFRDLGILADGEEKANRT